MSQPTGSSNRRFAAAVLLAGIACALFSGCVTTTDRNIAKYDAGLKPPTVTLASERAGQDNAFLTHAVGDERQNVKSAYNAQSPGPAVANYQPQPLPPGAEQLPPGTPQPGPALGQPNGYTAPGYGPPGSSNAAPPTYPPGSYPAGNPQPGYYPPGSPIPQTAGAPIAPQVQPTGNVPGEAPVPVVPQGEVVGSSAVVSGEAPGTPYPEKKPEGIENIYPSNINKTFMKAIGQGPNEKVATEAFAEGEKLFAEKKYKEAAKKFKVAADRWPDTALEEDAMFKEGEAYFFGDRYPYAEDEYSELIKKYPNSRYLDLAVARLFAIARYWEQTSEAHPHWPTTPNFTDSSRPLFDTPGHASRTFDNVRINDPRGPLADDAIMANGNSNFVRGRWEDADYYYTLLRKDYPRSQHQVQAHLLSLQCKIRNYQGPGYSTKPLVEAQELIATMKTQFPTELKEEMPHIELAYKECRAKLATRDYELAKWYDTGKHYGAARIMYASVIRNYSDTNFAQESQQRIAALGGKPDETPSWYEPAIKPFESEKAIARQAGPASSAQR